MTTKKLQFDFTSERWGRFLLYTLFISLTKLHSDLIVIYAVLLFHQHLNTFLMYCLTEPLFWKLFFVSFKLFF